MEISLSDFHFLRPAWLLLAIVGALLPLMWRRSHDQQRRLRAIIAPTCCHTCWSPRPTATACARCI